MIHYLRIGIVPAFLLLCLVLGGASAAGFWPNMGLQLAAILIIFWSLIVRRNTPMAPAGRQLLVLTALMLLVPLLQLVPLPPSIWTALPGRAPVADGFRLLGQPLPWLPISLAPARTVASLLWLLPALAVLMGIVRLGNFRATWIAWVVAIIAALSVAIGALQLAGGNGSPWYFYSITNFGATVGFFANSNHLATLLVATIPLLTALYLNSRTKGRSISRASGLLVMLGGAVAVVLVGIVINSSLAGIGLMVPTVAASGLLLIRARKKKRMSPLWGGIVALLLVAGVGAIYLSPTSNNLTSSSARSDPASRYHSFRLSSEAARDYLPFGSGVGTFQEIYPTYEDPNRVTRFYMNHAHGDYIELALESGIPGMIVLTLFLLWWLRRTISIWSAEEPDYFALGATIASGVILAHSLVDYPLRTAAISALFAACCALMAEPRARVRQRIREEEAPENKARHLSAD
ncbi:MAG: O-antigen ligase family protein [Allosphingosinicella sp.]